MRSRTPPARCRPPATSRLQAAERGRVKDCTLFRSYLCPIQPTGEGFVGAASDGNEVLDDVLAVGGLAATTLAQQDDGLILASGQEVPISSLGHAVNVWAGVFPSAAFKHLHYLEREKQNSERDGNKITGKSLYISITVPATTCSYAAAP